MKEKLIKDLYEKDGMKNLSNSPKKKEKRKTDIIRVGDLVKVINPEVFVRCGYPLCKEDMLKEIKPEHRQKLISLLAELGISHCRDMYDLFFEYNVPNYDGILNQIAFAMLKSRLFGGNRRQIFTKTTPELENKAFRIVNRRVVVSGRRKEEYDYNDGHPYGYTVLLDKTSHVLFELVPIDSFEIYSGNLWIEKTNLRKIDKNNLVDVDFAQNVDMITK